MIHFERKSPKRTTLFLQASLLTLALQGGAAFAQVEQDVPGLENELHDQSDAGNDIVVTASRANRKGYEAPTPTVVVGSDQLAQRAVTNVAQYLAEVPAFKATTNPTTNGVNQRSTGSNYVDLRGLGTSRTLVLVDGRRFVPQLAAGLAGYQVDLNQIPALLVDRVEVVTGGASAQWGSDAVAGVVNILLKKKYQGLQAEAQVGRGTHDDYGSTRFALVGGTNFADDRGNVTLAIDFEQNFGVGDVNQRRWGRRQNQLLANPCPNQVAVSAACPTGGNGQPSNLILPDIQFSAMAPGGLITNTALRGTTFAADGTPVPLTYGQFVGSTYMAGGSQPGQNFSLNQQISSPFKRYQAYGRTSFELSDSVELFGEASYARSRGGGRGVGGRLSTTIRRDNPFLPAALAAQMDARGIASFNFGRINNEMVSEGRITNETYRGVLGLTGTLPGEANWRWSATAGHGENKYRQRVYGATVTARARFAADAVRDGQGNIVCRATLPGAGFNAAAAGCIPMNVFGPGAAIDAASYVTATVHSDIDYRQSFATAEISGDPFSTWAGPVSVVFGGEYRAEREDAVADAISNAAGYDGNNSSSFKGKFNVKEVFGEVVVPILKDSAVGESLELNGAARYADYSILGKGQFTWKIGATYRPVGGLMLRTARSRDIRAPNIFERNVPASARNANINYGTSQPVVQTFTSGNPNLTPEKATTTTAGFSYQPPFVPGLSFSVDYFKIEMRDVIGTLSAQDVADLCRLGGEQTFCGLISFDGANVPTAIRTPFFNISSVDIAGIDGQLSYTLPLNRLGTDLPGKLTFSGSATYTIDAKVNSGALGAVTIDRSGETGPNNEFSAARFRGTGSITYSDEKFLLSLQARHISSGKYDVTFTPQQINDNSVEGRTYFDVSTSYQLAKGVGLFMVVNNMFDRAPPVAPTQNASPTNAIYFDTIGRVIKVGLRLSR